jgi:hypothetical protein
MPEGSRQRAEAWRVFADHVRSGYWPGTLAITAVTRPNRTQPIRSLAIIRPTTGPRQRRCRLAAATPRGEPNGPRIGSSFGRHVLSRFAATTLPVPPANGECQVRYAAESEASAPALAEPERVEGPSPLASRPRARQAEIAITTIFYRTGRAAQAP